MIEVTRGEFDMLVRQVEDNSRRLDSVDASGTRGTVAAVGVVQAQLTDVIKDVAELKANYAEHDRQHGREALARITGRRWLVGIGFAGVASMSAVITLLLQITAHLHR